MVRPSLHIQQALGLGRTRDGTHPRGEACFVESREGRAAKGTSRPSMSLPRLQWSRPKRHLSRRGTVSKIFALFNDEANFSHVANLLGCSLKRCFADSGKCQGYNEVNPNIELLRLRNFTIGKKISDEEVISPNGLDTIVDLICAMIPFVSSTPQSRCVGDVLHLPGG
jgi:hypothetical protein